MTDTPQNQTKFDQNVLEIRENLDETRQNVMKIREVLDEIREPLTDKERIRLIEQLDLDQLHRVYIEAHRLNADKTNPKVDEIQGECPQNSTKTLRNSSTDGNEKMYPRRQWLPRFLYDVHLTEDENRVSLAVFWLRFDLSFYHAADARYFRFSKLYLDGAHDLCYDHIFNFSSAEDGQ